MRQHRVFDKTGTTRPFRVDAIVMNALMLVLLNCNPPHVQNKMEIRDDLSYFRHSCAGHAFTRSAGATCNIKNVKFGGMAFVGTMQTGSRKTRNAFRGLEGLECGSQ
jgi:hypothetical protein